MAGYSLVRTSDSNLDLKDENGNVVSSFSPPVRLPDDVLPAILDDLGVTDSGIRSAVQIAATGNINIIDNRQDQ